MSMTGTSAKASAILHSEFVRQIIGTFGTRVGLVAAGVVTSVLIARSLGPEGRGALAIAAALTAIAIQLGNLGLHASNTWAVAKQPHTLPGLIGNSIVLSIVVGSAAIVVTLGLTVVVPGLVPIGGPLLWVALVAIPIGLASLLSQNLLLGLQRVRDYNILEVGARGLAILTTGALIVAGMASPFSFLVAGTGGAAIIVLITLWRLSALSNERPRPQLSLLRAYGAFGLKAYSTALVSFLVIRFDLFLVEAFLGFEAVGQYSISVAVADLLYALPVIIGTLLFPRLARLQSPIEQVEYARAVLIRVGIVMLAAGLAAVLLADPAISFLYGADFAAAIPAFVWLVPGIVALSLHTIVMNYAAAAGYPATAIWISLIGLTTNLVLNVLLLPILGIVGASIASSLAYGCMFGMSLWYFRRQLARARTSGLDPRPSDE